VAQSDQIELGIVSRLTSGDFVVNFQVPEGAAVLTSPIIPLQHRFSELFVDLGSKFDSRLLGENLPHEAFPLAFSKNACLS
jgi:hypothetical protein